MKTIKNRIVKIYETKSLFLLFAVVLIAVVFLSACTQQPSAQTGQISKEAEKATPEITLKISPESASASEEFVVSWEVSGTGKIPHTAIHYGPKSVADPKGPSDYPKATEFQCQDVQCSLPNSFFAKIKIDAAGTYYYRAHAVVDGKNVWSEEKKIIISAKAPATKGAETAGAVTSTTYGIIISNNAFLPRTVRILKGDTIVWENKDVLPHTISSYGGDELASDSLSNGQKYTHTFNTEGTFAYQCNIHPGMKGEIIVLSREPKVTITSAPALVATDQAIPISWRIDGQSATTPHTAVHYGPKSVADPKGPSDYPFASNFFCTTKACNIPNEFSAQVKISEPGNYSFRAHVVINGKNIWSDEKTVSVEKLAQPVKTVSGGGGGGGGGY